MFTFFRNLNAARRAAITSNPSYLNTLLHPHQLNNHSIAISKPPLLSVLTNFGSSEPATGMYVAPAQTGFKPLLPVIDVLTGQIFATDPKGGLTVVIVAGEPRVFLPLDVFRDPAKARIDSWAAPVRIDSSVGSRSGPSSPVSPNASNPNSPRRRTPRSMMSFFGRSKGGEL